MAMETFRKKYRILTIANRLARAIALAIYGIAFLPLRLFGRSFHSMAMLNLHRLTLVKSPQKGVVYVCDSPSYYFRSLFTYAKEVETVAWIERMPTDSVLWDVGANVGAFTLYAARRGCTVIAFEPLAANIHALVRNVAENGVQSKVKSLNVALHAANGISTIVSQDSIAGTALSVVDTPGEKPNARKGVSHESTVLCMRADEAIAAWGLPAPDFIKLDVDGNELDILRGATEVLSNPRLRGILVELEVGAQDSRDISDLIESHGFMVTGRNSHGDFENVVFERGSEA
jgi:FkbM family methyltransferase